MKSLFTSATTFLPLLAGLLGLSVGSAQTIDTARISGIVRDTSGAVVRAAVITVRNQATGWAEKLVSDASGHFVSPPLQPLNMMSRYWPPASQRWSSISAW